VIVPACYVYWVAKQGRKTPAPLKNDDFFRKKVSTLNEEHLFSYALVSGNNTKKTNMKKNSPMLSGVSRVWQA